MRSAMLALLCFTAVAGCAFTRPPRLTQTDASAAITHYYDSCHEYDQIAQCLQRQGFDVEALDAEFRRVGWLRKQEIEGTRTSSLSAPPVYSVTVPTPLGQQHVYSGSTYEATALWADGLWDVAPATTVVQRISYNANNGYYIVDAAVSFTPLPWWRAYLATCGISTHPCPDADGGAFSHGTLEDDTLARLSAESGRTARLYVWRSDNAWSVSATPPASAIVSFLEFIGTLVLIPVMLVGLYFFSRHMNNPGSFSGPGPSMGYGRDA